ncbi:putative hexaprenyl pyrophosphate synthase, mitochondrial [Zancudomyces culisetae]|uniref:Putative hexaprenyl pyrophosphate synthase, mitochondrial n=1 Tax=Zancudomyces culisetae TaxID=1213189 RepID=A0A1R1PJK0_ZANCU|nr:putative hexaprenyl pyrophosphate synthase, mitochondrial [Zancudomyces culisetae]OMH81140.1 putative hexaprenyl pyrophosphate synthase, mitochondrial [Zancudomyces culisetae]|eukprot:OMH78770.1 putative hexaprenyl pyrophosphate synthase, mitochondrial [Zancudomyces culisetae]
MLEWIKEPINASEIGLKESDLQGASAAELQNLELVNSESYEEVLKKAIKLVKKDMEGIDPIALVKEELGHMSDNISRLLESENPTLNKVAKYYFQSTGKQIRPLVVLLLSQAVNDMVKNRQEISASGAAGSSGLNAAGQQRSMDQEDYRFMDVSLFDNSLDNDSVVRDKLIRSALAEASNGKSMYLPTSNNGYGLVVLPPQRRLAEITELIHTASLIHDDIVDQAATRRGMPATHKVFGNKMAVLAGDFFLARASMSLARLRNPEVVELLATVIMDLVEGEFKQLGNSGSSKFNESELDVFNYYLQKTYLKTASLFANSSRATAILGNTSDKCAEVAYLFGKNLGIAFQLVDDLLDFTTTSKMVAGKPVQGADMKLGIATAPVLYAWQENPGVLGPLIARRFKEPDDCKIAWDLVHSGQALAKTRTLVHLYAEKAMASLCLLPPSPSRQALLNLTHSLIYRKF